MIKQKKTSARWTTIHHANQLQKHCSVLCGTATRKNSTSVAWVREALGLAQSQTTALTNLRRNAWSTHTNEITDRLLGVLLVLLHGSTPSCLRHYAANRTQSSIHAHEKSRRHRQQQRAEHWRTLKKHGKHNVALYWRLGDNAIDIRGEMCLNLRTTITVQARTANSMCDSDSKNVRNERRAMSSTVQENQDVSLVQTMQNNKLIGHGCPIQRLPCTDEWKCVHRRMQCHTSRRAILHRH